MMIAFFCGNILWIITSLEGFSSVNSGDPFRVKRCFILVIIIILTRILLYSFMGYKMKKFLEDPNKSEIAKSCTTIYLEGFYII